MLITESEREGTAQKEHSLKKCGRSVVVSHKKCGSHNNGGRETHLPHFLWHATLATRSQELVGIGRLRFGNGVSELVYFQK